MKKTHEIRRELHSWQEIADHFKVSVRTVQKWEKERGLPVRREAGALRGSVSARVEELDTWKGFGAYEGLRSANGILPQTPPTEVEGAGTHHTTDKQTLAVEPSSSASKSLPLPLSFERRSKVVFSQMWVQAVIALELGILSAYLIFGAEHTGPPAQWKIANNALVVNDDRGREVWQHSFGRPLDGQRYLRENNHVLMNQAWFGDLEGDGSIETLFVEQIAGESSALICFSEKGRQKWRYLPRFPGETSPEAFKPRNSYDRVADGSGSTSSQNAALIIRSFRVAKLGRNRPNSIIVVSQMLVNPPIEVALLSFAGKVQGTYWHDGLIGYPYALDVADLDRNGVDEIYLGGEDAKRHQATLVVLDPDSMGVVAKDADSPSQVPGLPAGRKIARVLFPRSCINRLFESGNRVSRVLLNRDSVTVELAETQERNWPSVLYDLDARLSLKRFTWSEVFLGTHAQLAQEQRLDHSLTAEEEAEMQQIVVLRP